jgi:hypothetical protein
MQPLTPTSSVSKRSWLEPADVYAHGHDKMEELVSSFAGEEPVAMDETAQLFREDGSVLRTKNPKDGARIPSNDSVFAQWEAPGNTFLDGAGAEDDDADVLLRGRLRLKLPDGSRAKIHSTAECAGGLDALIQQAKVGKIRELRAQTGAGVGRVAEILHAEVASFLFARSKKAGSPGVAWPG